jgi:hypothetical protein
MDMGTSVRGIRLSAVTQRHPLGRQSKREVKRCLAKIAQRKLTTSISSNRPRYDAAETTRAFDCDYVSEPATSRSVLTAYAG